MKNDTKSNQKINYNNYKYLKLLASIFIFIDSLVILRFFIDFHTRHISIRPGYASFVWVNICEFSILYYLLISPRKIKITRQAKELTSRNLLNIVIALPFVGLILSWLAENKVTKAIDYVLYPIVYTTMPSNMLYSVSDYFNRTILIFLSASIFVSIYGTVQYFRKSE